MPVALCLMGPTATGKTALAVALARRFPVSVISVDSAMVYRGLDIGTGKPDAGLRAEVPHALIDIRDPWQAYSAGEFVRDARAAVDVAVRSGRLPLLVGGTNLYFRSLVAGLSALPPADPAVRAEIDAEALRLGWPALHAVLQRVDPQLASRIGAGDRQRIQRALEVIRITGRPLSAQWTTPSGSAGTDFRQFALVPADRARLHDAIATRFDGMLAAGLVAEVARLAALPGMHAGLPAVRAVGYRQLWDHVRGDEPLTRARERAVAATRQLARRQLTWLRRATGPVVLDPTDPATPDRLARAVADAISGPTR